MKRKISVIGLGYVGLPLAVALSKKNHVVGFDVLKKRILDLKAFDDKTLEVSAKTLRASTNLTFSSSKSHIDGSDIFIATVPTPINSKNEPDLKLLKLACQTIGSSMKKGAIVVFESTVYPGCTEEVCVPILERFSNLKFNQDFYVGYSPERINPGDKNHSIGDIVKIISASDQAALDLLHQVYSEIISAGLYVASSIKIAEAAKIIENTQRDINIALMNEFSLILKKLDIESKEVIEAAASKWNFHKYYPGLVGGHCIGVDPYYLTYQAKKLGINPQVILSGRRVNDSMHKEIANFFLDHIKNKNKNKKILILGATFKENCPDIRNSKVESLIGEMNRKQITPHLHDPFLAYRPDFKGKFRFVSKWASTKYDGIFLAVPHNQYIKYRLTTYLKATEEHGIIFDFKSVLPRHEKILRW